MGTEYEGYAVYHCVLCCREPYWQEWRIKDVVLWALQCDDGKHFMSTSFWHKREDAVEQWNNMMEDCYCGYVLETDNFICDEFNF